MLENKMTNKLIVREIVMIRIVIYDRDCIMMSFKQELKRDELDQTKLIERIPRFSSKIYVREA